MSQRQRFGLVMFIPLAIGLAVIAESASTTGYLFLAVVTGFFGIMFVYPDKDNPADR